MRRQRSLVVMGWLRRAASGVTARVRTTAAMIAVSLWHAEARRRLLSLADRMLADIGPTRDEIDSAVNGALRRRR